MELAGLRCGFTARDSSVVCWEGGGLSGISIEVVAESGGVVAKMDALRGREVPEWRRRLVTAVAREVLEGTIARNPVDTGRSRSAWVAGLTELGGTPPAGWKGPHPDAGAIAAGAELGVVSERDSRGQSEIRVTNGVPYVTFLEFGTRSMAPREMVWRSLLAAREFLRKAAAL